MPSLPDYIQLNQYYYDLRGIENPSTGNRWEPPEDYLYLRGPHDMERLDFDRGIFTYIPNSNTPNAKGHIRFDVRNIHKALPEVYRIYPQHSIPLTSPLQHLWYGINPELDVDKWWTLVDWKLAFTNKGAGNSPHDPKANYVSETELDKKPPSFDQSRYTGGHIFRGYKKGSLAMLETIRVDRPLPTAEELLAAKHLWFYATSISPTGRIQFFLRKGKDGVMKKVRIPLFTRFQAYLPFTDLHQITADQHIEPNTIIHK